ncbi:MAG: succinate dehydrogenase, hydrophobic membrane anchor protein [Ferrovibrio sp.]|uniref:succinate dehydrogenase, hydrophobic membrane anchor protein n=1 Tax=Ferrovibrio sp. TaxID=1917215 RepID=UPI00260E98F6|nr:succinate dehydrogenase, hydrophobic membrane anchor protein [Ferrovibrio sp.]MCW0236101.1 succinate dehydrogenase, hydrophobic membrane anchor protein [Ferrovibrio sp.]
MSNANKPMRSALKNVRGLGAAKEGVQHWWLQRVTAMAMIPLLLVMLVCLLKLATGDHAAVAASFRHPLFALVALLSILAVFWHMKLGLQVVIEDYVHSEGLKMASLLGITFATFILGGIAALSVLKLFFGA